MPTQITMGVTDAFNAEDLTTGAVIPNPFLQGGGDQAQKNATGSGSGTGAGASAARPKKQAFFDKKTGEIIFDDGSRPEQVYDRAQHRRLYRNGDEWLPVPLSESEESAGMAVSAAQGVLFGGGDEFLAAVSEPSSAFRAAIGTEPQDGAYYKELERARELDTRYADENPWTSFGIKAVAGLPTALATGGMASSGLTTAATALRTAAPAATTAGRVAATMEGMATAAPTVTGRLGQAALGGTVYGGAAGYLSGEGDVENRAASAGYGAAIGALTGMALQTLSPIARWTYNRINQAPTFWNATSGTLTVEGQRAVIQAGGDPARVSREIAEAFAADMRTAANPRAALQNAELNASLYTPVPLTRGMRTGNPADQMLESRAREGSMGNAATQVMRESDDATRRALFENLEQVRSSASGGRPEILPGQGGAVAQRRLSQQAEQSTTRWRRAYNAAQQQGEASISPEAYNRIAEQVRLEMGRFYPDAFPATWNLVRQAFRFDARQSSERLVSSLFRAREQLVEMQKLPGENAAATAAKRAFDDALRSLDESELSGNTDAVRLWRTAIAERARHGREFERGVVGKIIERDPLSRELTIAAESVSDRVIGKDVSANGGLLRDIVAIRQRLGATSQTWLDFKQDVVLRILDKARGNLMSGRGIDAPGDERVFSATAFAEHVAKLMRDRPGLMRALFTPRELQALQAVSRAGKLTLPAPGGKQLGSSSGWASMIQTTFPAFYNSIRFVVDSAPVRGTINAASMGGVRSRAAGSIPEAPRSYGARNAITSLSAQRSAEGARESYAEGTPLQKTAQITGPIPVVGDAMGLAADAEGYTTGRLKPTLANAGLTALGVLPFIAAATIRDMKDAKKAAKASPWTQQDLQPVNQSIGANSQASPDELAKMAIESGQYELSDMQKEMSLIDEVYNGNHKVKVKTVLELAKDQDARAAAAGATAALRARTDEALDNFVKIGTREALEAIARNSSAAQWYRKSVDKAVDWIGKMHPEVLSDKTGASRARFMFALAMTSNGQDVASNAKYSEWVYEQFKTTGRMPEKVPFGGKRQAAMNKAMTMWNENIASMGEDKWIKFLADDHRIGDLKKMGFDVAGENVDEVMPGSVVLGPKVGAGFYSNLMGNFNPLTMDLWFMRTVGRRTGQIQNPMPQETTNAQIKAFRQYLTPKRIEELNPAYAGKTRKDLTDDEIVEFAREVNRIDERAGFKKNAKGVRPEVNKKAQRLVEGIDRILDQPGNGMDRRFYRQAYTRVLNNLRKHGIDISMADLQALDWYPEKDLFQVRGVGNKRAESTDYGTEFEKLYNSRQGKGAALPPAP